MKTRRRRVRITTRTQEVLLVREAGQLSEGHCPVCGSPFLPAAARPEPESGPGPDRAILAQPSTPGRAQANAETDSGDRTAEADC